MVFFSSYAFLCDKLFKGNNYYLGNTKRYWQLSIKDQNYDYIILGSSRAYGSIDVTLLDSLLGKRGINLGLDGSSFLENYISLKLFLSNGNKVNSIFLQIDPYSLMSEKSFSNPLHSYAYLPFWDTDKELKNILHKNIPLIESWSFYPSLLPYYIYNNYYSPVNVYKGLMTNGNFCEGEFDCNTGNKIFNQLSQSQHLRGQEILIEPNDDDILYYYKILKLAKDNNIKIITFMAPSLDEFKNLETVDILKNIKFHSPIIWDSEFFTDATHVNYLGRKLFTIEFGNFLLKRI